MKSKNPRHSFATPTYKTGNDITETVRGQINVLLNQQLASAVDLQMQMKQAHWNVKGPSFIALHKLFDEVYVAVSGYVDILAERIVQLGGIAEGTVRATAARTKLKEYPLTVGDGAVHIASVAKALASFGESVRAAIKEAVCLDDADTADIFTEVSRGTDKWLWFVEAHVQAQK